ncbi:MAG: hypothetical protein QME05_01265 [Candidatus Margulisbacteria bacterium]|nr:hypothetical protein [Candidatus Margulisiibacteriota bacterium]
MANDSINKGFSFGLTSGIITTLGLIVGLHAGTNSKLAVIGGILTIAIADAFSDALGIHISEEAENRHSQNEIWQATFMTFFTKFFFALTFLIPMLLLPLGSAIIASAAWGLCILGIQSYRMAKESHGPPLYVVSEHLLIALVVILITHYVGDWIAFVFAH